MGAGGRRLAAALLPPRPRRRHLRQGDRRRHDGRHLERARAQGGTAHVSVRADPQRDLAARWPPCSPVAGPARGARAPRAGRGAPLAVRPAVVLRVQGGPRVHALPRGEGGRRCHRGRPRWFVRRHQRPRQRGQGPDQRGSRPRRRPRLHRGGDRHRQGRHLPAGRQGGVRSHPAERPADRAGPVSRAGEPVVADRPHAGRETRRRHARGRAGPDAHRRPRGAGRLAGVPGGQRRARRRRSLRDPRRPARPGAVLEGAGVRQPAGAGRGVRARRQDGRPRRGPQRGQDRRLDVEDPQRVRRQGPGRCGGVQGGQGRLSARSHACRGLPRHRLHDLRRSSVEVRAARGSRRASSTMAPVST